MIPRQDPDGKRELGLGRGRRCGRRLQNYKVSLGWADYIRAQRVCGRHRGRASSGEKEG